MCLCHQTVQLGLVESDGSLPLGLCYHSSHLLLADKLEAGISSNACTEYARPPHFNNNDNNNNETGLRESKLPPMAKFQPKSDSGFQSGLLD